MAPLTMQLYYHMKKQLESKVDQHVTKQPSADRSALEQLAAEAERTRREQEDSAKRDAEQ
jgi:hypothetical protein